MWRLINFYVTNRTSLVTVGTGTRVTKFVLKTVNNVIYNVENILVSGE